MDIYKKAAIQQIRFSTSKGTLNTEQLFGLTLTELSNCIKKSKSVLNKDTNTELDFLDETTTVNHEEQLRFDILKDVYLQKKSDNDLARTEKTNKEHNQKIMDIIQNKKEQKLQDLSVEELEKLLV
jgi:hypothetical protein